MVKRCETIVSYSTSDSDDSLSLIDPVTNLSLEHIEKQCQDLDDQSKNLSKLHLNESNKKEEFILKRNKSNNQSRHHPYLHKNKSKINVKDSPHHYVSRIDNQPKVNYNMNFLKSLGYIRYSSSKESKSGKKKSERSTDRDEIRLLFSEVNNGLKQSFAKYLTSIERSKPKHFLCNRRFH